MHIANKEERGSGIPMLGNVRWGSQFCLFFQAEKELREIIIPYFKAGLKNKELCLWVVPDYLKASEARKILKDHIRNCEKYMRCGSLGVITSKAWAQRTKSVKGRVSELDRQILSGFDGLRLACGDTLSSIGIIGKHNTILLCAYRRENFDTLRLMGTVKKYQFALIKNAGKWEVLKSSEVQVVREALKESEEKLQSLFSNMSEGFAYCRIVLDKKGDPRDFVFLEVNESFERILGLDHKGVINKKASQVIPGLDNDPAHWIGRYGKVALTGKPEKFEDYSEALKKWFSVSAFS